MCEKKALFTENPKATKAAKENRYKKKNVQMFQNQWPLKVALCQKIYAVQKKISNHYPE